MRGRISTEFPLVGKVCYLNTATNGLMPRTTVKSAQSLYSRHLSDTPAPDLYDELDQEVEDSRGVFAELIGARKEEISFQPSTSTSLNFVVSMVAPVRGENVVIDDLGFPSGTFPMMRLKERGVQVRWVRNRDGLIISEDYEGVIDERTRLVIVSLVSWVNGLRAEVEEIAKRAHEKGALCMVDGTHGIGYIDLDAATSNIDYLATSNYKWLLSTHGATEFYCARRLLEEFEPPQLGWLPGQGLKS